MWWRAGNPSFKEVILTFSLVSFPTLSVQSVNPSLPHLYWHKVRMKPTGHSSLCWMWLIYLTIMRVHGSHMFCVNKLVLVELPHYVKRKCNISLINMADPADSDQEWEAGVNNRSPARWLSVFSERDLVRISVKRPHQKHTRWFISNPGTACSSD